MKITNKIRTKIYDDIYTIISEMLEKDISKDNIFIKVLKEDMISKLVIMECCDDAATDLKYEYGITDHNRYDIGRNYIKMENYKTELYDYFTERLCDMLFNRNTQNISFIKGLKPYAFSEKVIYDSFKTALKDLRVVNESANNAEFYIDITPTSEGRLITLELIDNKTLDIHIMRTIKERLENGFLNCSVTVPNCVIDAYTSPEAYLTHATKVCASAIKTIEEPYNDISIISSRIIKVFKDNKVITIDLY